MSQIESQSPSKIRSTAELLVKKRVFSNLEEAERHLRQIPDYQEPTRPGQVVGKITGPGEFTRFSRSE